MRWLLLFFVLAGCYDIDPVESCSALQSDCQAMCDDHCARIAECATRGASTCAAACKKGYVCVGETPDHDGAICRGEASMTANLSYDQLCDESPWYGTGCPGAPP